MTLVYFAWVRQKVGASEETIELPPGISSVQGLIEYLKTRGAGYAEVFAHPERLRVAINQEHASTDAAINNDDEVAFFPPVTGG